MGQERAAILDLDVNGNVVLPCQFKVKLKFSKTVYVSLFPGPNGTCHKMSINRDQDNEFNLRNPKTNKLRQFDFNTGVIPVEQFIGDPASNQVVVWFDEQNEELIFQSVFSE